MLTCNKDDNWQLLSRLRALRHIQVQPLPGLQAQQGSQFLFACFKRWQAQPNTYVLRQQDTSTLHTRKNRSLCLPRVWSTDDLMGAPGFQAAPATHGCAPLHTFALLLQPGNSFTFLP
jgi:hypothetical protein